MARVLSPWILFVPGGDLRFVPPTATLNRKGNSSQILLGWLALCLWAGSAWLYDLYLPGALTGLPRIALHNGLLALGCLAWTLWRREPHAAPLIAWKLAVGGAFLFAFPAILLAGAASRVTQATATLVFLLVPVVVVFWAGQQSAGFGAAAGAMRGLLSALAGLGGAALILPFDLPSALAGRVWLLALVASAVAAGVAAVAMHRLLADVSLTRAGSLVFGATCALAACFCWVNPPVLSAWTLPSLMSEAMRFVLIDAPILLLDLWLLRAMRPVAFSSSLLLIPAVTLLEGIVAERPAVGWYGWIGLVLLAGSSLVLGGNSESA